jgi:hypothetical protein
LEEELRRAKRNVAIGRRMTQAVHVILETSRAEVKEVGKGLLFTKQCLWRAENRLNPRMSKRIRYITID